jgi:uncharacterized protein YgbK (DUF1537 family)
MGLTNNVCCVVDAETQADLDGFAQDILDAAASGKRFLFRSAASLLTSLAQLGRQPVAPEDMAQYERTEKPGVVVVGSHVKKTTQQLEQLLEEPEIAPIEVDVARLLGDAIQGEALRAETLNRVQQAFEVGQTPVVYTSREELTFESVQQRLDFGAAVSGLLMEIVQGLPAEISFLMSKGGITSNDVLSTGLGLRSARLLGQILAGCSMVITPEDHPLFPQLPVVLFPGNVGDAQGLVTVYRRLGKQIVATD